MKKNLLLVEFLISLGGFLIGIQSGIEDVFNDLKSRKIKKKDKSILLLSFISNSTFILSTILAITFAIIFGNKYSRKGLIKVLIYILLSGVIIEFVDELFIKSINLYFVLSIIINFAIISIGIFIPIYIAEISRAKNRGAFLFFYSLMFILGNDFSNYFAKTLMVYSYILLIIPGIIISFLLLYIPNSPRWLCLINKEIEAAEILSKLNDTTVSDEQIKDEIIAIQENIASSHSLSLSRILLVYVMDFFVEFIGYQIYNVLILQYNTKYFNSPNNSSTSENKPFYTKVVILERIFKYISLILTIFIIDKVGRKRLLSYGSILLTILLTVYSIVNAICNKNDPNYIILTLLYLSIIIYNSTWKIVPYVYAAEIFPIHCRVKGYSIFTLFTYINILISYCIDFSLQTVIENYGSFLAIGTCLIAFLFSKLSVVETKGTSIEEVEKIFSKRNSNDKIEDKA